MRHLIDATDTTMADVYSSDHRPVATISPGDSVEVRTLDAHGHLEAPTYAGEPRRQQFPARRGHCLVGPIAVTGARPGQQLAIRFTSLRPSTWGFTTAGGRDNVLQRRLGLDAVEPAWLLWSIDADTGEAVDQHGHTVTTRPFLGVVGVGTTGGEHSTIPPRTIGGGNIDCRSLVAGSTLYVPVSVDDAMLYVGDGHAAQGDGEVGGTAIECGMTTVMTIDVIDSGALDAVHAVTPEGRITFGFHEDLNEAMATALGSMVTWMAIDLGVDHQTALGLASVVVDLRITQVANVTWGVHAVLDEAALRLSSGGTALRSGHAS